MSSIDDSIIKLWSDSVREKEFFWMFDKVVKKRVDKIIKTSYSFDTKDDLTFCRLSTIDDETSEKTCKKMNSNNQLISSACTQSYEVSHRTIWTESLESVWLRSQSRILHFSKLFFESQKVSDSSCSTLIYQFEDRVSWRLSFSLSWCQVCLDELI